MEENPEIKSLTHMVKNWKASYLLQVDEAGGNEYLVKYLERLIKEIESNGLSIG